LIPLVYTAKVTSGEPFERPWQQRAVKQKVATVTVETDRITAICSPALRAIDCVWLQHRLDASMSVVYMPPPKVPLPAGYPGPHLIHGCLDPHEYTTQTGSLAVRSF